MLNFGGVTGWWFYIFLIFIPIPGEMIQFDGYFSKGLKPPTSWGCNLHFQKKSKQYAGVSCVAFFWWRYYDTYHIYIYIFMYNYMIMITSKGQLPGDFLVGFITKKARQNNVGGFSTENLFLQSDSLEAMFNSLTTLTGWRIVVGWDGDFLAQKFFSGEFWRRFLGVHHKNVSPIF